MVRLNGATGGIFKDWLEKNFPDRFDKVWHMIQSCHGGQVNDSRFGERMRGNGNIAQLISDIFKLHCRQNKLNLTPIILDSGKFRVPKAQLNLF